MACIQISDRIENYLVFDMRDILDRLRNTGPRLSWFLLDLEARTHPGSSISIIDLEREVSHSENGKRLTWVQLQDLANQIFQTINCVLVGLEPGQDPPRLPLDDRYGRESIVIVAFDSSFWTVCAPQEDVILEFERTFKETRPVDRPEPNYSR